MEIRVRFREKFTLLVLIAIALAIFVTSARADCGDCAKQTICAGDSVAKLIEACGKPVQTQSVAVHSMIPGTDHSTTNVVEKWFYRVKGSLHTYTVVGGKITDVDVERAAP